MNTNFRHTPFWLVKSFLLISTTFFSCHNSETNQTFVVRNKLEMNRSAETIEVPAEQISSLLQKYGAENIRIRELDNPEPLLTQAIDLDSDGEIDQILFQTDIKALEEKTFVIEGSQKADAPLPEAERRTFSRFVPENNEDYAWENDRVAFRAYGRVTEARESGGTVSGGTSGIDAFFKRVSYPVLDKWYKKNQDEKSKKEEGAPHTDTYHTDYGEGYDPYIVGGSRGVGGTGIWEKDSLFVSKPFIEYKRIATGPIRTIFELTYAPWEANNRTILEKKRISLDRGSNLSRFEVEVKNDKPVPNLAAGIALHDKEGEIKTEAKEGWFRYWESIDDSEVGVGIVADPSIVQTYIDPEKAPDQENLLIVTNLDENNKSVYYAGFGWKKSGQFSSAEEWDRYLHQFSMRLGSPLEVKFEYEP